MSFDGAAALREINDFVEERRNQKEPLTESEQRALDAARKDAMHAVLHQQDATMFKEFDRMKLVDLEYLYQVRGVRQVVPSAIFGEGYAGYGNGWTGSRIRLLYLQDRKRAGRMSREAFLPMNKIIETADLSEQLVPLRINLTTEKFRLQDRLLWNADDTTIPLELFVENTLEDYGLPLTLASQVSQMLQKQISNHLPHIFPTPKSDTVSGDSQTASTAEPGSSELQTEGLQVSEQPYPAEQPLGQEQTSEQPEQREQPEQLEQPEQPSLSQPGASAQQAEPSAEPSAQAELAKSSEPAQEASEQAKAEPEPEPEPEPPAYDEDMRITIKLDITIGHHQLIDQFEWDINNQDNDPEMFGIVLANELSLPQEFGPAVAHAIREQSQYFTRSLFTSGYQFDGTLPADQQLQSSLSLPVDEHAFLRRPEMLALFSPALNDASIAGLNSDHHEQDQERRELRSRRRQGRSSRRGHHHHEGRAGGSSAKSHDVTFDTHEVLGPEFCTPVYSSVLPGGLDRNLDILHMTAYHLDEAYGGDRQDILYYFHKHKRERNISGASQFESGMITEHKPRWIVKLKVPKQQQQA